MRKKLNEPVGDDLHNVVKAINDNCFNKELNRIPMYFMATNGRTLCLYENGDLFVDMPYYNVNGISNKLIHAIFHEMLHAFCEAHGIQDTDGDRHLEAFADECERHGGVCAWSNSQYGYSLTGLRVKKMKAIKADLRQKGA